MLKNPQEMHPKRAAVLAILAENAGRWVGNREIWHLSCRRAASHGSPVVHAPHIHIYHLSKDGLVETDHRAPIHAMNGDRIARVTKAGMALAVKVA